MLSVTLQTRSERSRVAMRFPINQSRNAVVLAKSIMVKWKHYVIRHVIESSVAYRSFIFAMPNFMMTSSNENIFRVTGLCAGNSPITGEFLSQRPVTRTSDVFFDLCLNTRLSKQSWGWWFETPSHSLWRHCYVFCLCHRSQRTHMIYLPVFSKVVSLGLEYQF